ncbi:hypothetical protein JWG44_05755 [Leptospira sp. 201903071]|uniref:hypothetical protein n=1 Tax=Leptospira ainazelensis TaxID=2810034 RepID=UPI00196353FF|nr:hypothetical protein [Leptospira ainazelensis]MBM9499754.1 hypothetical protein [Leptospira ainazelensis]
MNRLRVKIDISLVNENGGLTPFPTKSVDYVFEAGSFGDFFDIDNNSRDSQVTPIQVDLSRYKTINAVFLFANYIEADPENGIKAGDPAKIQFQTKLNGEWKEAEVVALGGFQPEQLFVKAMGTRRIRVTEVISSE